MDQEKHEAYLLLGSNIEPEQNIARAVAQLQLHLTVLQVSSVWQSDAMGSSGPDFLNAAVLVSTELDAGALKEQVIHPLEAQMGRVRSADKNASRTIDIDIIIFDGLLIDPALWKYAHRAVPVAELMPYFQSENGEYLKDAALRLASETQMKERKDVSINSEPFNSKIIDGNTTSTRDE